MVAMLKIVCFGVCLALLLAACATTPSAPPTAAAQIAKQMPPVGCVASTGTTLPAKPTSCTGPGNTYSFDDLQRTGATTIPGALRQLDPSLTISH
jgi:hypothetical protein